MPASKGRSRYSSGESCLMLRAGVPAFSHLGIPKSHRHTVVIRCHQLDRFVGQYGKRRNFTPLTTACAERFGGGKDSCRRSDLAC